MSVTAERTSRRARRSPAGQAAARLGLASRGVIYLLLGALAVELAVRHGRGRNVDRRGAMQAVAAQPGGVVLLVALTVGFAGYAVWRFLQAASGEGDRWGGKVPSWATRLAALAQGILYSAFAVSAAALVLGDGRGGNGGDGAPTGWTARALRWPGGRIVVGGIGIAVVAGGVALAVAGLRYRYEKHLDVSAMPPGLTPVTAVLGAAGMAARGAVIALAGTFLIDAAITFDPAHAKSLDGTLRAVVARPFGPWLLGACAAGLAAYGLYSLVEARYRRV